MRISPAGASGCCRKLQDQESRLFSPMARKGIPVARKFYRAPPEPRPRPALTSRAVRTSGFRVEVGKCAGARDPRSSCCCSCVPCSRRRDPRVSLGLWRAGGAAGRKSQSSFWAPESAHFQEITAGAPATCLSWFSGQKWDSGRGAFYRHWPQSPPFALLRPPWLCAPG